MQPEPVFIEEKRLVKTLLSRKPSSNAIIVAALTVLFMTLMTFFYWNAPAAWGALLPAIKLEIFQHGQLWRIFSAIFVHADIEHLLSNMYMLFIFSFFVYGYFGGGVYPALSLVVAGLVNAVAISTYAADAELIGASGLVYILGGFWLTLYVFIQRQYSVLNRLMRVTGIAFVIFLPSTFVPTTSYRTHAIGFAAGVIMGIIYFRRNKIVIRANEIYKTNYVEAI